MSITPQLNFNSIAECQLAYPETATASLEESHAEPLAIASKPKTVLSQAVTRNPLTNAARFHAPCERTMPLQKRPHVSHPL
jgi:hypothetical protein